MALQTMRIGATLAAAMLASGCMEMETVVAVRQDGSGTVTESVLMREGLREVIKDGFLNTQSTGMSAVAAEPGMESAVFRARAAAMGEGVRFVSAADAKRNGKRGVTVVYEFADVRELKLSQLPDASIVGVSTAAGDAEPVTFDFTAGDRRELVVNIPPPRVPADTSGVRRSSSGAAAAAASQGPSVEELATVKEMFRDFRARLIVAVEGEIRETNAAYVDSEGADEKKRQVTIFDIDLGGLAEQADGMAQLSGMAGIDDIGVIMARLKNMPSMKVEPAERVTISFQ